MSSIFFCCFKAPAPLAGSDTLVKIAAEEAERGAASPSPFEDPALARFRLFSLEMCWSAVARCALEARSITEDKYKEIKTIDVVNSAAYVTVADTEVATAAQMKTVPAGSFLGFFEDSTIVHGMLALGDGRAAGNKNSCIGLGSEAGVGWENLDLAGQLPWIGDAAGGFQNGPRRLTIHYRPLDAYQ